MQHSLQEGASVQPRHTFSRSLALIQDYGPEQVFKPRFRRPDSVRVDRHRQFARVPGSLACHLVRLGDGLAKAQAERQRHRMRRLSGPILLGPARGWPEKASILLSPKV